MILLFYDFEVQYQTSPFACPQELFLFIALSLSLSLSSVSPLDASMMSKKMREKKEEKFVFSEEDDGALRDLLDEVGQGNGKRAAKHGVESNGCELPLAGPGDHEQGLC